MEGANKKFLDDPLGFFQRHIVLMNSAVGTSPADIMDMDLVPASIWKRLKDERSGFDKANWSKKETVTVAGAEEAYYLTPFLRSSPSKHAHPIKAYWLHYQQQQVKELQLGGGATLMFTPTLNGCTFAVGPGANPTVVHANFQKTGTDGRQIDQAKMDAEILKIITPVKIFRKADYQSADHASVNVTVLGINTGQWRFYWQSRVPENTQGDKSFTRLTAPQEIT
jgi:hypothetical protein